MVENMMGQMQNGLDATQMAYAFLSQKELTPREKALTELSGLKSTVSSIGEYMLNYNTTYQNNDFVFASFSKAIDAFSKVTTSEGLSIVEHYLQKQINEIRQVEHLCGNKGFIANCVYTLSAMIDRLPFCQLMNGEKNEYIPTKLRKEVMLYNMAAAEGVQDNMLKKHLYDEKYSSHLNPSCRPFRYFDVEAADKYIQTIKESGYKKYDATLNDVLDADTTHSYDESLDTVIDTSVLATPTKNNPTRYIYHGTVNVHEISQKEYFEIVNKAYEVWQKLPMESLDDFTKFYNVAKDRLLEKQTGDQSVASKNTIEIMKLAADQFKIKMAEKSYGTYLDKELMNL